MMMWFKASNICRTCLFSASKLLLKSREVPLPPRTVIRASLCSASATPEAAQNSVLGYKNSFILTRTYLSSSAAPLANKEEEEVHNKGIGLLKSVDDQHGGVIVNMNEHMDSLVFSSMLEASLSHWKKQGKKGVWIKLPIQHSNLVASAVKAGFRYHHAEPDYLMLVHWIPNTPDTIPPNASHRVAIGAFVMNTNREVLVVQESNGRFSGKGIWKLPTGAVDEGEDICEAAIREVKEETGIDTEFVEVLAFRQSHKTFFQKSDLFFVCMLQPYSFNIQRQVSEIAGAQWMPVEDYVMQPFVRENELFDFLTKICVSKSDDKYNGFSTLLAKTSSHKKSNLYFNKNDVGKF